MRTIRQGIFLVASTAALTAQVQVQQGQQMKDIVVARTGTAAGGTTAMISTFNFVAGEMVGGSPVKGAPYSAQAVTQSTQALADGNRIVNNTSASVYRDSEGRERREQSLPNIGGLSAQGAPTKTIFISDPVAGVNYSLDPSAKTAVKLPAMKMGPPPPPGGSPATFVKGVPAIAGGMASGGANVMFFRSGVSDGAAPAVEQLGSQVINGVSADGTRTTVTIPAGQIGNDKPIQMVDEVWRSSELQVIVQSEHSDPRMGSTTYSLTNISRSEPSPALFQVPSDYTVTDAPKPGLSMATPPQ